MHACVSRISSPTSSSLPSASRRFCRNQTTRNKTTRVRVRFHNRGNRAPLSLFRSSAWQLCSLEALNKTFFPRFLPSRRSLALLTAAASSLYRHFPPPLLSSLGPSSCWPGRLPSSLCRPPPFTSLQHPLPQTAPSSCRKQHEIVTALRATMPANERP